MPFDECNMRNGGGGGDRRHDPIDRLTDVVLASMIEIVQKDGICVDCAARTLGAKALGALIVRYHGVDRKTGDLNPERLAMIMQWFMSQTMEEVRAILADLRKDEGGDG